MGLVELLIIILVIAWLLGYFGRGRLYGGGGTGGGGGFAEGNLIHTLLVIAVILIVLRVLGVI